MSIQGGSAWQRPEVTNQSSQSIGGPKIGSHKNPLKAAIDTIKSKINVLKEKLNSAKGIKAKSAINNDIRTAKKELNKAINQLENKIINETKGKENYKNKDLDGLVDQLYNDYPGMDTKDLVNIASKIDRSQSAPANLRELGF